MKIAIKTKPGKIEKLVGQADDVATSLSDDFVRDLSRVLSDASARVQDLMLSTLNVQDGKIVANRQALMNAIHAQDQIEELLQEAGYGELIDHHVRGYNALLKQSQILYKTLWPGFEWKKASLDILQTYQLMDFSFFNKLGSDAAASVASNVYQSTLAGRSFKQVREGIKGALSDDLKQYAHTYAQDSLMGYNRAMDTVVAKDLDVQYYYFSGTVMGSTRPWCGSHVGKTYTKKEVEAWNGQNWKGKKPGDVRISLGGWNCRHRLIPVSKEWVEENLKN